MLSSEKMEALKTFTEHRQRLFLSNDLNNWIQGGYSEFHLTGMIEGFFGVWNFLFRYFFVSKILFYVGIFLRIQNNLRLSFCITLLMKQKMFFNVSSVVGEKASIDIRHGIFSGGLIFVQGFFLRFNLLETLSIFSGGEGWFLSTFEHPSNLKSGKPLPLRTGCHRRTCYIQDNSAYICSRTAVNLTTVIIIHLFVTSAQN